MVSLHKIMQFRQDSFQNLKEVASLFLSNTELETSGNGYKAIHDRNQILAIFDFL